MKKLFDRWFLGGIHFGRIDYKQWQRLYIFDPIIRNKYNFIRWILAE